MACNTVLRVRIGRERLRQILHEQEITFQRTRTWKRSTDPDFDAKLDRTLHAYLAGATPTPATPTCSRPNAANEPVSAASAINAGADHEQPDQTR